MTLCLLGLGSNEGDRVGNITAAIDALRQSASIRVRRVSSFYETAPVGGPPGQRKYFNAAAIIETELLPADLMAGLLEIERRLGRRRAERWGPGTINGDLRLYGESIVKSPQIAVPHPRMHERRFVLAPAAEIATDWRHPAKQQALGQLLAALPSDSPGEIGVRVVTSPCE